MKKKQVSAKEACFLFVCPIPPETGLFLILIPLKTIAMVLSDPESQNDFQGILNL